MHQCFHIFWTIANTSNLLSLANMKFIIIAALVAVALASDRPYYSKPAYYPKPAYPSPAYPAAVGYDYAPMPYSFDWAVLDQASYNDFGHKETSDGNVVTGTYFVVLPDGRRQVVTYKADDYGYVADVKYEGEATYPEYKPSYPAYPKPAYAPPAYPKPTYSAPAYPKPTYAPPAYPKASYPEPSYPTYPRPSYPAYPRPAYPSYPRPSYPSYPKPSYPVSTTTEAVTATAAPVVKEAEEAVEAVAVTEPVSEAAVAAAEPIAEPENSTDAV